jgi:adenylate cyclase
LVEDGAVPADPDETMAALERELLGGERRYTRGQVAELAGVDVEQARTLWRALGFADVEEDNVAFTDRDVEALRTVTGLVALGVIEESVEIAVTRAMGQTLSRLAEWQVATILDAFAHREAMAVEDATAIARELVPVMDDLIGYVWRRHLAATAGRALADERADTMNVVVGFADLVGFTSLTRQVDEAELATVIDAFEGVAGDVIAELGGRVVKTVGDEVMFIAPESAVGAEIALQICEKVGADERLPDVRVGAACGQVLSRLGDVYGEPVNIAARLTSVARPGSVVIDRELGSALEHDARFSLRRMPPRPVRGYSLLHGFRLRRAEAA